jgi:hypothetical protein
VPGPLGASDRAGVTPIRFGEAPILAIPECIDSLDYDMIRHGHCVLAELVIRKRLGPALLSLSGCPPPVSEQHIEPHHELANGLDTH